MSIGDMQHSFRPRHIQTQQSTSTLMRIFAALLSAVCLLANGCSGQGGLGDSGGVGTVQEDSIEKPSASDTSAEDRDTGSNRSADAVDDESPPTEDSPNANSSAGSEASKSGDTIEVAGMEDESQDALRNFEAGIAAYQANDLPLAYRKFRAAAEQGHADSQFNLALMYERGIGVAKDETKAVSWYDHSASQGNSAAQYNLGVLYENGRGTPVDFEKANQWYRKASVQGDPLAIGNLGMLYLRGQGVEQNTVAAVALLIVSASMDPSPDNHARQNLSKTPGLTPDIITTAQTLAGKLMDANNLLEPLDEFLKTS